jgi:hypothetical protein
VRNGVRAGSQRYRGGYLQPDASPVIHYDPDATTDFTIGFTIDRRIR